MYHDVEDAHVSSDDAALACSSLAVLGGLRWVGAGYRAVHTHEQRASCQLPATFSLAWVWCSAAGAGQGRVVAAGNETWTAGKTQTQTKWQTGG